eukprot:TRINITY_DN48169_c0_g1_i1.p1 TRINITY_DN48169_c0_g1~~TRINITY_DN48169_c0_g1_i1.p1  ORF type:complete len:220 (+),score=22.35 TRINITY_DN48169_c0_g1_i1:269-928(+)
MIPGREGKQCRERWFNHLAPNVCKDEWTPEEQYTLYLAFKVHNSRWTKLTAYLPRRTENSIKNHWNSIMKRNIYSLQKQLEQQLKEDQSGLHFSGPKEFASYLLDLHILALNPPTPAESSGPLHIPLEGQSHDSESFLKDCADSELTMENSPLTGDADNSEDLQSRQSFSDYCSYFMKESSASSMLDFEDLDQTSQHLQVISEEETLKAEQVLNDMLSF